MTMSSSTARPRKAAAKKPQDRKLSLRDQLKSKQPHTTHATFPIGEKGEAAKAALEQANQDLALLRMLNQQQSVKPNGKQVDLRPAEAEVEKAEAAYRDASMTIVFRGLDPTEVDALSTEFDVLDPTPAELEALKEKGEKPPTFDFRGYTCALLAAAAVDSDLTVEDWDEELYESGRWSDGEVSHIRDTARAAYREVPGPGIPKG